MTVDDQPHESDDGPENEPQDSAPEDMGSDATIGVSHEKQAQQFSARTIGGYQLIKELGAGGQGAVYLAEDTKLKRRVALKILSGGASLSAQMRLRFEREAETTGRLNHPGIARIYELGEDDGILFIAMELIEGQTLESRIAESRNLARQHKSISELLATTSGSVSGTSSTGMSSGAGSDDRPFLTAITFLEGVARALHTAHEAGLIHRDIKPANIMMRPDGSSCILDFGLVHDQESQEMTLTQSGDIFGTPAYMAPEQVQGQTSRIDPRTDVWALGAALYECCTLKRPFEAATRHDLFQSIIQDEPLAPSRVNRKIPKDLDAIILTAIDKDPERRYATAFEFAEDLRRLREYEVIHARPPGAWVKTVRWVQRNRVVAVSGLFVFIAVLAAAGVFYVKGEEANEARVASQNEAREKNAALADFERLADVKKLQEAMLTQEILWPARPEKIEALKAWLAKNEELSQSLPGHEASLKALRASALPYTEDDRLRDHAETLTQISALDASLSQAQKDLKASKDEKLTKAIEQFIQSKKKEQAALEEKTREQLSWNFGNDSVKLWKHNVLAELVKDLRDFVDEEEGTYTSVKERLTSAQEIAQRTIDDYSALWTATRAAIKSSDKYDGLDLKPQLGLIPLGPDPRTELHEFLHLETHEGPLPQRNQDGKFEITDKTGIILVLIPKGKFWMGSQKDDPTGQNFDPQSEPDEELREAEIPEPFFLSKYEMTQGQWARSPATIKTPSRYGVEFGEGDSRFKAPVDLRHPVETVSWTMCDETMRRLGLGLPTEEQWEYAARAGTSSIWVGGQGAVKGLDRWGNLAGLETKGIFETFESKMKDDYPIHAPVGQFKANLFGLFDALGNVWEWTSTRSDSSARVPRGGSFSGTAMFARVAYRSLHTEEQRSNNLGLRPSCQVSFD